MNKFEHVQGMGAGARGSHYDEGRGPGLGPEGSLYDDGRRPGQGWENLSVKKSLNRWRLWSHKDLL